MGQIKRKSVITLIVLFSLSALLINARSEPPLPQKSRTLTSTLGQIPGWVRLAPVDLDEKIVRSLELDDYVNSVYARGLERVSLYVGYYFSSGKVGAAHDPMVCFPGQGWSISDKRAISLSVSGHPSLNCSIMVAELGNRRELVLYWFQAYDTPIAGTFRQKLVLLWKKIMAQGQDNAFVRVTTSLNNATIPEQQGVLADFVAAFYPLLIDYVHDGNSVH